MLQIIGTVLVVGILALTHKLAYQAGYEAKLRITTERLKESIVLSLKDEKEANHKRKDTKQKK